MTADTSVKMKEIDSDELPEVLDFRLQQACHHLGTIHYRLACHECKLGRLELAESHLKQTFEIENRFRMEAFDDPHLKPLWDSLARG